MENTDLFKTLSDAVLKGDQSLCHNLAQQVIDIGIDPYDAISKGLMVGMNRVGDLFSSGEYFVPELMRAARAMQHAVDLLQPHIKGETTSMSRKVVIGTVKGDVHDVGKNIVCMLLNAAGHKVYDLGVGVRNDIFLMKAMEVEADILGMSSLLSTTMENMPGVIQLFEKEGYRDKVKIIIGGAATTRFFADEIGANAWAPDGPSAVKILKALYASQA